MAVKVTLEDQEEAKEKMTMEEAQTKMSQIMSQVNQLEEERSLLGDDVTELKKEFFEVLKSAKPGHKWTKKAVNEAFRLAKMEKGERDVMHTQASTILRDSGRGEIDLQAFS